MRLLFVFMAMPPRTYGACEAAQFDTFLKHVKLKTNRPKRAITLSHRANQCDRKNRPPSEPYSPVSGPIAAIRLAISADRLFDAAAAPAMIAWKIARYVEAPCVMMTVPGTPSSGAPP